MLKLISVVLILLLYVLSGYGKIVNFDSTVEGFSTKPVFKHMPLLINQLIMVGVVVLLIGCSFMILYSLVTINSILQDYFALLLPYLLFLPPYFIIGHLSERPAYTAHNCCWCLLWHRIIQIDLFYKFIRNSFIKIVGHFFIFFYYW